MPERAWQTSVRAGRDTGFSMWVAGGVTWENIDSIGLVKWSGTHARLTSNSETCYTDYIRWHYGSGSYNRPNSNSTLLCIRY